MSSNTDALAKNFRLNRDWKHWYWVTWQWDATNNHRSSDSPLRPLIEERKNTQIFQSVQSRRYLKAAAMVRVRSIPVCKRCERTEFVLSLQTFVSTAETISMCHSATTESELRSCISVSSQTDSSSVWLGERKSTQTLYWWCSVKEALRCTVRYAGYFKTIPA